MRKQQIKPERLKRAFLQQVCWCRRIFCIKFAFESFESRALIFNQLELIQFVAPSTPVVLVALICAFQCKKVEGKNTD